MTLLDLIRAHGDALALRGLWDDETRAEVHRLTSLTLNTAQPMFPTVHEQVTESITALYAHGFMVGRDHALRGMLLPTTVRVGLTALTKDDLSAIVVPDDISGL